MDTISLKKGESFSGNYKGISKGKTNLFFLVLNNSKTGLDNILSISEGLKSLIKAAHLKKELIINCEMKVTLIDEIENKKEGMNAYKKYSILFGNGNLYIEPDLEFLDENRINNFLK